MKNLISILLFLAVIISTPGCTQNDGDIGPWFGTWRLEQIIIDGTPDNDYNRDIIWKFQADVISMVVVNDVTHTAISSWGTWTHTDNTLTLNFTYSDTDNPAGSYKYAPPAATYLPPAISLLQVVSLSKGEIVLEYVSEQNINYIYKLAKHG
ncbi:MAG: lipocalin-like domain-containing protein [Muribaculaceae bacterium]|nr:lipocalin-like domain-containing protein [Muribaculaceae bacterium]